MYRRTPGAWNPKGSSCGWEPASRGWGHAGGCGTTSAGCSARPAAGTVRVGADPQTARRVPGHTTPYGPQHLLSHGTAGTPRARRSRARGELVPMAAPPPGACPVLSWHAARAPVGGTVGPRPHRTCRTPLHSPPSGCWPGKCRSPTGALGVLLLAVATGVPVTEGAALPMARLVALRRSPCRTGGTHR